MRNNDGNTMTGQRGVFAISIDLEMAWGTCDRVMSPEARGAVELERTIVQRLLELFSEYEISATWAVVGHLLLESCEWAGDTVHPEIRRPVSNTTSKDWFFQHPRDADDPIWYARDVVKWIRDASPRQEIGSHSFCHMSYDTSRTHEKAVKADILAAKRAHDEMSLPFDTFVFPRNVIGSLKRLADAGVKTYRGNTSRWHHSVRFRPIRRVLNLANYVLAVTPPTVSPSLETDGMMNIPDSMLFLGRNGVRRLVRPSRLEKMAVRGLERAARDRRIFHLWFHPSNFAHETEGQFAAFESILRQAQQMIRAGQIENLAMDEVRKKTLDGAYENERGAVHTA